MDLGFAAQLPRLMMLGNGAGSQKVDGEYRNRWEGGYRHQINARKLSIQRFNSVETCSPSALS